MKFLTSLCKCNPFRKIIWMVKNWRNWIPRRVTYHALFWALSIFCLFVTVGDRLWTTATDGDLLLDRGSRKFIPPSDSKLGDWLTNWFWIITARTLIVSLNMSFVTVMWMIPNFLDEALSSFIDSDVRHSHLQIHKFAGIWLNGFVVVIHTALIFLPTIIDGTPMKLMTNGFNFDDWWDPCVRKFKSYITDTEIYFTVDEIFRLVLSVLCFVIMMPLSRADWMLYKSYSVAMAIHGFAGFAFMWDMLRKNSHPLCWRFNLPFILLYCIDRLFSMFIYRVNTFKVQKVERVSDSCFVLYGWVPKLPYRGQGCGDNYWLLHRIPKKSRGDPMFQRAHPYTSFQNWDESTRHLWNVGFVIKTNNKNRHSWSLWLMNRGIEGPKPFKKQKALKSSGIITLRHEFKETELYNISEGVNNPTYEDDLQVASNSNTYFEATSDQKLKENENNDPKENKTLSEKGELSNEDQKERQPETQKTQNIPLKSEIENQDISHLDSAKHEKENQSTAIQITGKTAILAVEAPNNEFELTSYGPYRSSFYVIGTAYHSYEHLVLIAGGSGFGFFMSALTMINDYEKENKDRTEPEKPSKLNNTTILYSARDMKLINLCGKMISNIKSYNKCRYVIQYTGAETEASEHESEVSKSAEVMPNPLSVQKGRMDVDKVLSEYKDVYKSTLVCACASSVFLEEVKKSCYKHALRLRVEEI